MCICAVFFFFFQAEDGIRDVAVTGVQTCALPIYLLTRRPGELAVPPVFVAFDWLWSRGRDLRGLPLGERLAGELHAEITYAEVMRGRLRAPVFGRLAAQRVRIS